MIAQVNEGQNEAGGKGVPLGTASGFSLIDSDGSESVQRFTFDLSSLISDAGIQQRLIDLEGAGAGLQVLVNSYIDGEFTFDATSGSISVQPSLVGGVYLRPELFLDSNQDFSIPVTALVRDTASIGGSTVTSEKTENSQLQVDLVGTADTPTVFAESVGSALAGTATGVTLGGEVTDTDVALGRILSEEIYYILTVVDAPSTFALVDGSGSVLGYNNGDAHWLLLESNVQGLRMYTLPGVNGTYEFDLTSVAVENDGDLATKATSFDVVVIPGGPGVAPTPSLPPILDVGINQGIEDQKLTLSLTVTANSQDTTTPTVAVMISGVPEGSEVFGARWNPVSGRYVAIEVDINAGNVKILPPKDFSGTLQLQVEAVATNAWTLSSSTGIQSLAVPIDPVADGVDINLSAGTGLEDQVVSMSVGLATKDQDGSEQVSANIYVRFTGGATLQGGFSKVVLSDSDSVIDGKAVVGYYRVPQADASTLNILPASNWHGNILAEVAAFSMETSGDVGGDYIKMNSARLTITVQAVADPPIVTALASVSGNEDTSITLPGLSASLVDTVTTGGAEVLSVKLWGLPVGSILSAGSNNGDGSWGIPATSLSDLQITPPEHFAGVMQLTLTAYALELSNGSEAETSRAIRVNVAPIADSFLMVADNIELNDEPALLDLSIRLLDTRGTEPGEVPAEFVTLTFDGLPAGIDLWSTQGGRIVSQGSGSFEFRGNEAQANALVAVAGPGSAIGTGGVSLSGITTDATSVLSTPVVDSFLLTTTAPVVTGQVLSGGGALNGGDGNDVLQGDSSAGTMNGGAGDDLILPVGGSNTLKGGTGMNLFRWTLASLDARDTITDFTVGANGDILDLSLLFDDYNPQSSDVVDYVRVQANGGNLLMQVSLAGNGSSWTDVAELLDVAGVSVDDLASAGNLLM